MASPWGATTWMLLCIRMIFLQTCLDLLSSSENSTHSLQGTEWSENTSKYYLIKKKQIYEYNFKRNRLHLFHRQAPRHKLDTPGQSWLKILIFFQYFRLKPPRCHSGREASSCRGRCPFQPGLAQGTWDYHCMASFWFGIGRLVRFWATVNFDIHYDGISM